MRFPLVLLSLLLVSLGSLAYAGPNPRLRDGNERTEPLACPRFSIQWTAHLMWLKSRPFCQYNSSANNIPLTVRDTAGIPRTAEPVSSGIPLPFGAVTDTNDLWLTGPDGTPVPAQFTVLSRWNGPVTDTARAVKWVLVDFQADVPANGSATYYLHTTPAGQRSTGADERGSRGAGESSETRERKHKESTEMDWHCVGRAGCVGGAGCCGIEHRWRKAAQ